MMGHWTFLFYRCECLLRVWSGCGDSYTESHSPLLHENNFLALASASPGSQSRSSTFHSLESSIRKLPWVYRWRKKEKSAPYDFRWGFLGKINEKWFHFMFWSFGKCLWFFLLRNERRIKDWLCVLLHLQWFPTFPRIPTNLGSFGRMNF